MNTQYKIYLPISILDQYRYPVYVVEIKRGLEIKYNREVSFEV